MGLERGRKMAYFPLYINMERKHCVVVGGGSIAAGKVGQLLEFGAAITVIAPEVCTRMTQWKNAGKITLIQREFCEHDIDGAAAVVAASSQREVNRHVSELCKKQKIPVNVVDDKELCTFYFPALIRKGEVVVSVSTGGSSPALAAFIRRKLEAAVPDSYGRAAKIMGMYREEVLRSVDDREQRKRIFHKMLADVLAGEEITEKEVADYFADTEKDQNWHEGESSCTGADRSVDCGSEEKISGDRM